MARTVSLFRQLVLRSGTSSRPSSPASRRTDFSLKTKIKKVSSIPWHTKGWPPPLRPLIAFSKPNKTQTKHKQAISAH